MKYWKFKVVGTRIRAAWNEAETFNMQWIWDGRWVDYHCFTVYGIKSEQEALAHILEALEEELKEDENLWKLLQENPAEMDDAIIVL